MPRTITALSGPSKFRRTVVKRFIPDELSEDPEPSTQPLAATMSTVYSDDDSEDDRLSSNDNSPTICPVVFSSSRIPQSNDDQKYASSRQKDIDGVFERGVFSISKKKNAEGLRIYESRLVDHVRHDVTPNAFEESTLVVQGFSD